MRYYATKILKNWIIENKPEIHNIAVVGGSSFDPEFQFLHELYPLANVHFLGIDNSAGDSNYYFLDLDKDSYSGNLKFDLVLCSQVLEHVWNLENAFRNLRMLMKTKGYLWINVPASNFPHGSPHYYSAGYHSDFLARNLEYRNFSICISKVFGSKRNYFITHILREWVPEQELRHPILKYSFKPGTFLGVSKKYLFDLPGRLLSLFFPNATYENIDFATESVVLAQFRD